MSSISYTDSEKRMLAAARRLRVAAYKDLEKQVLVPAVQEFLRLAEAETPDQQTLLAAIQNVEEAQAELRAIRELI